MLIVMNGRVIGIDGVTARFEDHEAAGAELVDAYGQIGWVRQPDGSFAPPELKRFCIVRNGIVAEILMIADTCPLILPIHRDLDALREDASGAGKIGTTRRGIGPAYEDKVGRRALRLCDLAQLDDMGPLLDRLCAHHDALRAGFGEPPVDRQRL